MATMIKFRAWNQIDSEYINEINAVMSLDGSHIWWDINDSGEMKYEDDPGNYKLEQFTGLKDVNGKDIYEGDIVEVTSQYWGMLGNRYEVKFEQGAFYVKYGLLSEISPSISVIGNVHEKPELLEKDK
ncbi:YopX family protein [Lactiplantibacillus plantarum]|uniref:YopX family protein n=1 Tax=Lactiplantibacillus plantarum TaxID=1590 RepID=UPI003896F073